MRTYFNFFGTPLEFSRAVELVRETFTLTLQCDIDCIGAKAIACWTDSRLDKEDLDTLGHYGFHVPLSAIKEEYVSSNPCNSTRLFGNKAEDRVFAEIKRTLSNCDIRWEGGPSIWPYQYSGTLKIFDLTPEGVKFVEGLGLEEIALFDPPKGHPEIDEKMYMDHSWNPEVKEMSTEIAPIMKCAVVEIHTPEAMQQLVDRLYGSAVTMECSPAYKKSPAEFKYIYTVTLSGLTVSLWLEIKDIVGLQPGIVEFREIR